MRQPFAIGGEALIVVHAVHIHRVKHVALYLLYYILYIYTCVHVHVHVCVLLQVLVVRTSMVIVTLSSSRICLRTSALPLSKIVSVLSVK